jgi:hypothetical protein
VLFIDTVFIDGGIASTLGLSMAKPGKPFNAPPGRPFMRQCTIAKLTAANCRRTAENTNVFRHI